MSSDTSVVTILELQDCTVDLRVRTTTAGGLDDLSLSRSFALLLLTDARRRAMERGTARPASPTPLEEEAVRWQTTDPDWFISKAFMQENVGRYIASTEVLARRNVHGDAPSAHAAVNGALARVDLLGLSPREAEDALCETMHVVDLRVNVTEPRWLAGLEAGLVFGSTAFDVWWADPARPPTPAGTPAPTARWRVYAMDEKYWAIRHDGASHTVHYGKLATKGQQKTKTFASADEAARDVARLIREKTAKGYESEVEDDEDAEEDA